MFVLFVCACEILVNRLMGLLVRFSVGWRARPYIGPRFMSTSLVSDLYHNPVRFAKSVQRVFGKRRIGDHDPIAQRHLRPLRHIHVYPNKQLYKSHSKCLEQVSEMYEIFESKKRLNRSQMEGRLGLTEMFKI